MYTLTAKDRDEEGKKEKKEKKGKKKRGWEWGGLLARSSPFFGLSYYGSEQPGVPSSNHSLSHKLGSEWVSEQVSKQTNERSRARKWGKQCGASKWASGASEWVNGWASGHVYPNSWLFWTTVQVFPLFWPMTMSRHRDVYWIPPFCSFLPKVIKKIEFGGGDFLGSLSLF